MPRVASSTRDPCHALTTAIGVTPPRPAVGCTTDMQVRTGAHHRGARDRRNGVAAQAVGAPRSRDAEGAARHVDRRGLQTRLAQPGHRRRDPTDHALPSAGRCGAVVADHRRRRPLRPWPFASPGCASGALCGRSKNGACLRSEPLASLTWPPSAGTFRSAAAIHRTDPWLSGFGGSSRSATDPDRQQPVCY